MKRQWFALKNFHMQFFEDASVLNDYLGHWAEGQSMEDFYSEVWHKLPWYLKVTARLNQIIPPYRWFVQWITHGQLKSLAGKPDGTLHWIREGDAGKIKAFFGSLEKYKSIPAWDVSMPSLDKQQEYRRLDHGYDETKEVLEIEDLQKAAQFRGGSLMSGSWNGDSYAPLTWRCCQDHTFHMTPHTVLKGGHWCVECILPPWDYQKPFANSNFVRQVLVDYASNSPR